MKRFLFYLFLSTIAFYAQASYAGTMAINDFRYGAEGLKQDAVSLFSPVFQHAILGIEGRFTKTNAFGNMQSAKLPLTYTGEINMGTITPFAYSHFNGMTAYGGSFLLSTMFPLENETEDKIILTLSGGHAFIKGEKADDSIENFQQTALNLSAEAEIQKQFKFNVGAGGFFKPTKGIDNCSLKRNVFDFKDLIDIQGYSMINDLPEWVVSLNFHRTFQPDFDNSIYMGYSQISFRNEDKANSYVFGMEFFVSEDTTWNFGYNYFKRNESSEKQYFRILVSTVF